MEALRADDWARETFSRARLGDPRRVKRLVAMAAAVANSPAGTVTATMGTVAAKEGAFRFLESDQVETDAVSAAVFDTTALACGEHGLMFVAIDQSALSFADRQGIRGLGPVTDHASTVLRGMQVMSALAVDETGTPVGLLDQQVWLRPEKKVTTKKGPSASRATRVVAVGELL